MSRNASIVVMAAIAMLPIALIPIAAGCDFADRAKSQVPEKVQEAIQYSDEVYLCASSVFAQVHAAGKRPPMPAILAFCAAVIGAPDLPAAPQVAPEGDKI
jgi:hypothetical protein